MPFLKIEGAASLYYEDHGAGKPVVLIHGYPLSGSSWEKQLPALLGAGYRVITYDRRGFGRSSQPATGYDYDTFAADLHRLLDYLELREFALVGFSMGGGEIARYCGKYGSAGVTRAVIISGIPPYLIRTPDNPDGLDPAVFEGIQNEVRTDRYVFFAEFFKSFYNTDLLLGRRVSERAIQASWGVAAGASAMASLACVPAWHEDFREDLVRLDVPTLVIHGDDDRIVPFEAAGQRTARMVRGAHLHVVKGGPHGVIWTHAEEVNAALLGFLDSESAAVNPCPTGAD
jgi:non-heme chloroperoxidase